MTVFTTSDGVSIDFNRIGDGEAVILVHGGATTHRCFDLVAEPIAERFSVIRYDRRGHGASGDRAAWTFRREVDDLIELADHIGSGSGVCVLGYSFGGLVALEAVRTSLTAIHAVVAYEPPYGFKALTGSFPEVQRLLGDGRLEDAARLFLTSSFLLGDDVVDAMRRHPMWQITLGVLPNLRREMSAVMSAQVAPAVVPSPPVRVLVAESGGNPAFDEIALALEAALGSETVRVPGLPHFAMATAPERFAAAVLEHLSLLHPPT